MICRGCLLNKELDSFPVRNDRSGRLRPYCHTCSNTISRARYLNHKLNSPFKHRCTRAKNRASSLGVPFDLTPEYLQSIWTGECPVFKTPLDVVTPSEHEYAAELDRFIPEKGYVQGNVAWLSRRANRLKNNVTSTELEQLITWMKIYENQ